MEEVNVPFTYVLGDIFTNSLGVVANNETWSAHLEVSSVVTSDNEETHAL
jgi:hypothetical protein